MRKIAIVGASGLVGDCIIKVLQEENIQAEYIFFTSAGGKTVEMYGKKYITEPLNETRIKEFAPNYALFAVSGDLAKKWAFVFTECGCAVIDNSSAFRRDEKIPLIVPECNPDDLKMLDGAEHKIAANPNCSTIGAVVALKPLHDAYKIKRIVYSTYQAISGAGANPKFAFPIKDNLIPQIDDFCDNGYTKEEEKMIFETKKILGCPKMKITATAVRVPVANCHSIAINVEFKKKIDLENIKKLLGNADGVVVADPYPMPIFADGRNEVFVGRVRLDPTRKNTINLFTASDNVRKGAAVNAVQILKLMLA